MKRLLLSLFILVASVSLSLAQNPVTTLPYGVTISNASGTINSTNTFQSVLPASSNTTGRTDCLIQNIAASNMFIYFGSPTLATTTNSLTLASGATFRCNNGGVVIKNQISITGTSGQRFFAVQE